MLRVCVACMEGYRSAWKKMNKNSDTEGVNEKLVQITNIHSFRLATTGKQVRCVAWVGVSNARRYTQKSDGSTRNMYRCKQGWKGRVSQGTKNNVSRHTSKPRRNPPRESIRCLLSCHASCQRTLCRSGGILGRPIWIVPTGSVRPANRRVRMRLGSILSKSGVTR